MSAFVSIITAALFGALVLIATPADSRAQWLAVPVALVIGAIQYGLMQHMNSKIRKEVNNGHQG